MIDYRTAANAEARTLVLREGPLSTSLLFVAAGTVFGSVGALLLWGAITSSTSFKNGGFVFWIMGLAFAGMGWPLCYFSAKSLRQRVRLSVNEEELSLSWLQGKQVLEEKTLRRIDILDVQLVEHSPKKGKSPATFRVAIVTPHGQVPLQSSASNDQAFYIAQRAELRTFLQIE
jgi:hypothetical protein